MLKSVTFAILIAVSSSAIAQTSERGEIRGPFTWKSTIYPGTARSYWVYVPKAYDPSKPACLMVVQDGLSRATGWKLPNVLDSLINTKKIPVMLGVFVDHGTVTTEQADAYPRYNRSFEYDAMGDRYARFLLEELLPEVSRAYNISKDPNDRSIAGASSGAICAFNVAWERPDQFRRVLSTIGTYVGLRGADEFATLVRKTEPKPLRVYLQDGTNDLNIYAGDWWMANQTMLSALTYAGYEVNHGWGEGGGHDSKHSITILAEAMSWLWSDYPTAVQTHAGVTPRVNLLVEGAPWTAIPLKGLTTGKMAVHTNGELFFSSQQTIHKLDHAGNITPYANVKGDIGGLSFNNDGELYVSDRTHRRIIRISEKGVTQNVVSNVNAEFLCLSEKGIYFAETTKDRIGFYSFSGKDIRYTTTPFYPTGFAISAEHTFMNVATSDQVFGYSYEIKNDGTLDAGQPYIHYHIPYGQATPGTRGMTVDSENLLYTATAMGIQVSDQLGRVNFIFSRPGDHATELVFGGEGFSTIIVNCGGQLFSRKLNAKGILSWLAPVKPPKPGL